MKLLRIAPLALITVAFSCSDKTGDDTGTGGSAGSGVGGSAGHATGGTAGTGGSAGTATTGGSAGTATTGGSAGTATTGGSAGTTSTAGSGGSSAGTGGSGAGEAGETGTGGTAGGGTAGGAGLDPNVIVPGLDGLYWELRTNNETAPTDPRKYWLTEMSGDACPSGGLDRTKVFTAAGTAGQKYTINFEVRALMALRCYTGGTPSDMMPNATGTNNTFYAGGMPFMDSPINTYQLAITPAVTGEATSKYFLNGLPDSSGKCDEKITYMVSFKNKIVIMGDSTITLSNHLPDCQALQNCGADATGDCMPRTVDVSGIEVHASPYQPVADIFNDTTFYPQWMTFDVQSITSP
jgi:hypothetical protein